MKCYKLTDANGQTCGGTQWGPDVTHETDGHGELCGSGWLHSYNDPLVAVLHNPIGANFGPGMRLWEAEGDREYKNDNGMKQGHTRLTTIVEMTVPAITTEQRIKYGILFIRPHLHQVYNQLWSKRTFMP